MKLLIKYKLFLVILLANSLVAMVIFSSIAWNFNRGFNQYIRDDIVERLLPLVGTISLAYENHNNQWQWLRDKKRVWRELIKVDAGNIPALSRGEKRNKSFANNPGSRLGPMSDWRPGKWRRHLREKAILYNHLHVRDKNHRTIIRSKHRDLKHFVWIPISAYGEVVGELGFPQDQRFSRELDQLFVKRLYSQSVFIIFIIIVISAIIAFPFSIKVSRPIIRLSDAMRHLSAGNIRDSQSLPVQGHDELAQLSQSFNYLSQTLNDHLDSKQQWVADISHELRTPVAVLRAELEALMDGVRTLELPAVHSLHDEVMRLSRLIEDLYYLSLSDSGALNYRRQEVNLVALVEQILGQAQAEIDVHKLRLETDFRAQELIVDGDPDRMTQLIRNLLNNTLRYTHEGGLLNVVISADSKNLILVWQDSSPGVSNADLNKLFERLYRGDQARDRVSGGSGLGLSICKAIVDMHQGEIHARASQLGGLAIEVKLPLCQFN